MHIVYTVYVTGCMDHASIRLKINCCISYILSMLILTTMTEGLCHASIEIVGNLYFEGCIFKSGMRGGQDCYTCVGSTDISRDFH